MDKMQTRERKPLKPRTYSPPRSAPLSKKKKKKSQPKKETNNVKNLKTKKEFEKNTTAIELKNDSKKQVDIPEKKKVKKKKSSNNNNNNTSNNNSNNSSLKIMSDDIKAIVPQDLWRSWSSIRQESFKQIIKNPNSFFYRNRLPGDPQKYGAFTAAEEKQFIERLKYFREELGINDGLWGYFSVPILGRVGYQCSNFYRSLIISGKIVDSSYELMPDGKLRYLFGGTKIGGNKPPQKVMRILEDEALTFIKKCFDSAKEEGEVLRVMKPIIVKPEKKEIEKETKNNVETESDEDEIIIQIGKSDSQINKEDFLVRFNTSAIANGKKRGPLFEHKDDNENSTRSRGRRSRKYKFYNKSIIKSKGPSENGGNKSNYEYSYDSSLSNSSYPNICPIIGAIDPFSHLPMEKPMMDPLGVVLDRSSWKKIFNSKSLPPFDIAAYSMRDLIELNSYNFEEYRYFISNLVC